MLWVVFAKITALPCKDKACSVYVVYLDTTFVVLPVLFYGDLAITTTILVGNPDRLNHRTSVNPQYCPLTEGPSIGVA